MAFVKKEFDPIENASQILGGIKKGALLSGAANGKENPMTVSWGSLGIEWGVPIVTAYVRESRHTRQFLDANPEFTISVPIDGLDAARILALCGKKSGRDCDKIAECGLTQVPPSVTSVGGYAELPVTLECRVVYRQEQDPRQLQDNLGKWYPPFDGLPSGNAIDAHCAFYGQVVAAYTIMPE